jgi:hypothetical protein
MEDVTAVRGGARERDWAYVGFQILHWCFVALPTVVGIDKFFHRLANWNGYLAPQLAHLSPLSVNTTMRMLGCVEMLAGLIVALKPRIGGVVVALWLCGIVVNLMLARDFYDIVVRDLALACSALSLAFIASRYARR